MTDQPGPIRLAAAKVLLSTSRAAATLGVKALPDHHPTKTFLSHRLEAWDTIISSVSTRMERKIFASVTIAGFYCMDVVTTAYTFFPGTDTLAGMIGLS